MKRSFAGIVRKITMKMRTLTGLVEFIQVHGVVSYTGVAENLTKML
jgi:hypothetical protein